MAGRRFEVISDVTDVEAIAVGRRHPRARSPSQALRSRALAQDEGSRFDPSGWYEAHGIGRKEVKRKRYVPES